MHQDEWLSHFIFCRLRNTRPNGAPLYSYKCNDKNYTELLELVKARIGFALKSPATPIFTALFCLFAAETWRRCHTGGSWKWETVFSAIDQTTPKNQVIIRDWVESGLRYWKRPILKSQCGHQEYLVTIACEGGLPLNLLIQQSANLKQYFRELLTEYHDRRYSPSFDITTLARQIALIRLPRSLHQDIVYRLSGDLIQSVVVLQEEVAGAVDPIAALDKKGNNWRNSLPLSLEDEALKALLGGLLDQAKGLAQKHLVWRRRLIELNGHWTLENRLDLPVNVNGASLQAWTNRDKHAPRLRLFLRNHTRTETIARLTRTEGEGEAANYRLEELRKHGVRFTGLEATTTLSLWLSDGESETKLPISGALDLSDDLPWVFVEHGSDKIWLGEGSARTRAACAWVLAPPHSSFTVIDGTCETKGNAPRLQRELYAVQGRIRFDLHTGESCLIQCSAESNSEEEWLLTGKTLPIALNQDPVFLGMPRLEVLKPGSRGSVPPRTLLEWRALSAPNSPWSRDFTTCAGKVLIRAIDLETQSLRVRRQAEVLPVGSLVEILRTGGQGEPGLIRLSSLSGASVIIPPQVGCKITVESVGGAWKLYCRTNSGLPITQFRLELHWTDERKLTLLLPFPCQGAAFVRGEEIFRNGQTMALGRLGAVKAVAQSPNGGGFWLEATVKAELDTSLRRKLWLREKLKPDGSGRVQFDLHRWEDRLDSLLAMTRRLDSSILVEIRHNRIGAITPTLEVARFDVAFQPDREHRRITLSNIVLDRLGDDWQNRVTVKMIPLWDPSAELTLLLCDPLESDPSAQSIVIHDALSTHVKSVHGLDASISEVTSPPTLSICRPYTRALLSGLPPVANANIFRAALVSLSCKVPQFGHSHFRTDNPMFSILNPQSEQTLLVGSKRPMVIKFLPYHWALYSNSLRISPIPTSLMARDNFRL